MSRQTRREKFNAKRFRRRKDNGLPRLEGARRSPSSLTLARSGRVVTRDAIAGREGKDPVFFLAREPILHYVRVFIRVVVMAPQDADRLESLAAEKELSVQVRLANFDHDFAAALLRELVDQAADHLFSDALALHVRCGREVQDAQLGLMQ